MPVPSLDLLSYRVPPELDIPAVGMRVLVPLGARIVTGCVVRHEEPGGAPAPGLRDLADVLDEAPYVPAEVIDLALWVAEYYLAGAGETLAAVAPPGTWRETGRRVQITDAGRARLAAGEAGVGAAVLAQLAGGSARPLGRLRGGGGAPLRQLVARMARQGLVAITQPPGPVRSGFRTERVARITAEGLDLLEQARGREGRRPLGARQVEVLAQLAGRPGGLAAGALAREGVGGDSLRRLAARGLVSWERRQVERDPFRGVAQAAVATETALVDLTAEQQEAVETLGSLAASGTFQAALLHGVTGSGKTEVYLRLARQVEAAGRAVLVLVPEIALTPAAAARFRAEFGERVAVQHSGLSDGERHDQWHRIRRGDVQVVVGTRSAVFAPLERLGLIVVDEEHDGSYKQEEAPRYHGRDVAVMRAKRAGALIVLGSATPSLETYRNALSGRYARLRLTRRVLDRPMAEVRIVDMREVYAAEGPDVVLSVPLREALGARLERGEQALILLNRRGFAVAVFCRECARSLECPNCSLSLTVHRSVRKARCHYCGYATGLPVTCPACGGGFLEQIGLGTERVEAEVRDAVPGARVARLDRDTSRRRGALTGLLDRFGRREIDVLVGTQMIAKGHDFASVTLVGVISADVGLGMADFRAAERTFQLLTQVVGRAGRGTRRGEAIVQTLYPRHYSIRHACRQDYSAFFEDEIAFRDEMRYPPVIALVNIVVRGGTAGEAMERAASVADVVRRAAAGFRVLGPAPAPLGRLKGEYRAQFFLKGTSRAAMRAAVREALARHPALRRRVTVDVDPLGVL